MFIEGYYFFNYITSLYLVFTPFIILNLKAKALKVSYSFFEQFFKIFSQVLIVINISAFIYAIIVLSKSEYPDDVFTGLYGTNGFGSHSLSIINILVSMYYAYKRQIPRFVFFLVCGILGFYGLGLLIFMLTIVLLSLPILLKKIKLIAKGLLITTLLVFVVYLVNPKNINYIRLNLKDVNRVFTEYSYENEMERVLSYQRTFIPRFFTFVDGSQKLFFSDIKIFSLGASPGTYNSRTAFYLNGDFVQNEFFRDNFSKTTTYHEKYVKPLLNRKLLSARRWNDGTRNQPFSSIVAIFLEYGFFLGLLFFLIAFIKVRYIVRNTTTKELKKYLIFSATFLFLLFFVQNYIEYPEIILVFVIILKLVDIDNASKIEKEGN